MKYKPYFSLIIFVFFFSNCSNNKFENVSPTITSEQLFYQIPATESGIYFKNNIHESYENNLHSNDYLYSGGGVSVGDINNDGLQDILLVSNESQPSIYLNQGKMKFKDISRKSGLKNTGGWSSGSNFIDINQDGFLDIYICKGGQHVKDKSKTKNLLYINNGDLTFTERAKEYGLDDNGTSIQAAFFDYDKDGDLDVYVMNVPSFKTEFELEKLHSLRSNAKAPYDKFSDHIYQNQGNGKFIDVTKKVGVSNYGHGLGLAISDLDNDNWPDIFISNDFLQQDFYYSNKKGKFKEKLSDLFGHNAQFAMGADIGDINNDGWLDVFEVEMAPEDRKRSIKNMKSMDRKTFEGLGVAGFSPQYMRNALHLNHGGKQFSEIAQFAHVNKTDWSWGTLILDLDDDGHKDIFVANGIAKDIKDRDFAQRGNELAKKNKGKMTLEQMNKLAVSTPILNYAFKNNGDLTFKNNTINWGFDFKGFSNGVAYGDLDNDGDLDLIVNNLNNTPLLYLNTSSQKGTNFINIKLNGFEGNRNGLGAKVKIFTKEGIQYQELQTVRGFQSSSQNIIHFGLGKEINLIEKIEITWPNDKIETLTHVEANQFLEVFQKNANEPFVIKKTIPNLRREKELNINFTHKENYYDDFEKEILLPHKLSQLGPCLAKGDINGDGKEDFYMGGSANYSGKLFISSGNQFNILDNPAFELDKNQEDIGAHLFDADNDGDLDLIVVSGSNQFPIGSKLYQDRLYTNDGKGNFSKSSALPNSYESGSCVISSDFDNDGDLDLFIGGRGIPGKYPYPSKSFLLQNNNGKFIDITKKIAPDLEKIGMVTSGIWTDFDKDGDQDLIIVGEWTSILIFKNDTGKFTNITNELNLNNTKGWWNNIIAWDYDKDGDDDYFVGNIGLNHKFKASKNKPFQVFCNDFDNSGNLDIVLAYESKDKLVPVRGRDCSSEQMPFLADKFPTFADFGNAGISDMFDKKKIKSAIHLEANLFASIILKNNNGKFEIEYLPKEAQLSAVNGFVHMDVDNDGKEELIVAGNMFQTEAETSRADASIGSIFKLQGTKFTALDFTDTGFMCRGDVKGLVELKFGKSKILLAPTNDSELQVFQFD